MLPGSSLIDPGACLQPLTQPWGGQEPSTASVVSGWRVGRRQDQQKCWWSLLSVWRRWGGLLAASSPPAYLQRAEAGPDSRPEA